MAAGDLITRDGQHELNGLLMGPDTSYRVMDYGAWGTPPYRNSDTPRPQEHGQFATGPDLMDARPVPYEIMVRRSGGATPAEILDDLHTLGEAWAPVDDGLVDLVWQDEGTKYRMRGRPRGIEPPESIKAKQVGHLKVRARFVAHEAYIYGGGEQTGSTGLGSRSGGLDISGHDFPHAFGTAEPGSVKGTNDGSVAAPWTSRITAGAGGLINPRVTLQETDEWFEMSITLAEGEFLDIDVLDRSVLLAGTASRTGKVRRPGSTWFKLPPGDVTLLFSGSGAGTFEPSWRSAYAT